MEDSSSPVIPGASYYALFHCARNIVELHRASASQQIELDKYDGEKPQLAERAMILALFNRSNQIVATEILSKIEEMSALDRALHCIQKLDPHSKPQADSAILTECTCHGKSIRFEDNQNNSLGCFIYNENTATVNQLQFQQQFLKTIDMSLLQIIENHRPKNQCVIS
jgi:hypothetical protein